MLYIIFPHPCFQRAEDRMLETGETGLTIINTLPCEAQVTSPLYTGPIQQGQVSDISNC